MQKIRPISQKFTEILRVKNFEIMIFCCTLTYENCCNKGHLLDLALFLHFSTLGATRLVRKVSIDQLTLAGLSTNISADRPADLGWCMVTSMTS